MELTLESAFSTGGFVGHTAYLLLVISMLMRVMVWLRIFVIVSSLVAITYAGVWLRDPVSVFWETLLVTVNVVQLMITWWQNRIARFSDEEAFFFRRRLRGMPPGAARRLFNAGVWEDLPHGMVLTVQGERVTHLTYIAEGSISIHVDAHKVAECGAGQYIGEMALIDRQPASATAIVEGAARVWRIESEAIFDMQERKPERAAIIEAGIARDMREKLIASNLHRA